MEITCILIYDFFPVWQFIFRPGKRLKNHRSQKFCIHLNPSHRITYGPFVIESVDFLLFLTYIPILVSMEFPDFFLISSCSLRHRHLLLFSSTKYLYRWDFTSFVKKKLKSTINRKRNYARRLRWVLPKFSRGKLCVRNLNARSIIESFLSQEK